MFGRCRLSIGRSLGRRVQGGPVGQYDYSFQQEQHLFAAAGYVVLSANPRGSSGRGQAFCQALFADCKNMILDFSI